MVEKGRWTMSINSQYMPSFLEEFRSMKLEMMIRDLQKLNPEELQLIQKEIESLLEANEE